VVHFPNRGTTWNAYGMSEIENAVPLQNALNRTLTSMVMTSELTAFPIRYAMGFQPPAGLTPGMWLIINGKAPLMPEQKVEVGVMEQGQITPFIDQAQWLSGEIGKITRTPAPEFMGGDNSSGEALKQREIGLLGKVRRFQVKGGNRWEDVMKLTARVQAAFGQQTPPAFEKITAQWADPELRNDKTIGENAKILADLGYVEEALRAMAPVFGWDEARIQDIIAEKAASETQRMSDLVNTIPTYSDATFGLPTAGGGNGNGAGTAPMEETA
jgi:hypothetical protein